MKGSRPLPITLSIMFIMLCSLTLSPSLVMAERFVDLYAGGTVGTDGKINISASGRKATGEPDFDESISLGYRLGYWFDEHPWLGLTMDLSFYRQDTGDMDLSIIPLSALLMIRMPLAKSYEHPMGAVAPYLGLGPGIFFSNLKYEVSRTAVPDLVGQPGLAGEYSDRSVTVGLDARAGISWMIHKNLSLFGEYRYTDGRPDFEVDILGVEVKTEAELEAHHVLIGFSYPF